MPVPDQAARAGKEADRPTAGGGTSGLRAVQRAVREATPWLLCSALSGLLLALSFPPADLWPLAFAAFVPLLIALDRAAGYRMAALCGAATAAVAYLPSFRWVASVTVPGWLGLAFYGGLYLVAAALLIRFFQRQFPLLWPLLAALLWVALELFRARLGPGFPWLFLGYTQYRFVGLVQLAALGGVYAVSFVVFLVGACLAALIIGLGAGRKRGRHAVRGGLMLAGSSALLIACAVAGGHVKDRIMLTEGPVVGVVQQNFPRLVAEIFDERKTLEDYYREREWEVQVTAELTAGLRGRGVRMAVWPESTAPVPLDIPPEMFPNARELRLRDQVIGLLGALGADMDCYFLVGAPAYFGRSVARSVVYGVQATPEFGNSAVMLTPDAQFIERYDKIRLVPFGEYIPLRESLPFLQAFTPIPREITPGTEEVVFSLPGGEGEEPVRFGALVCYEDVFPELCASFRRKGVDFLVNVTDEGWYHIAGELRQHLAMAVFRAVETRTTVVRAANTGVSCFINPRGEVYAELQPLTKGALSAPVQLSDAMTPYVRYGDAFAIICLMLAIALPALLLALRPGGSGETSEADRR